MIPLRSARTDRRRAQVRVRHSARRRSLGFQCGNIATIVRHIRAGFPYRSLEQFQRATGLPLASIARLVRIPPRTLARRRATGRLRPDESERLLRVSRVFDKAVELFAGDVEATRYWLTSPSEVLGDQTPLDSAQTEIGAREVEDLIGRLEHGVFT